MWFGVNGWVSSSPYDGSVLRSLVPEGDVAGRGPYVKWQRVMGLGLAAVVDSQEVGFLRTIRRARRGR